MRLVRGPVPERPDFQPESCGWHALREPELARLTTLALLAGLPVALLLGAGIDYQGFHFGPFVPLLVSGGALLLIPAHELVHAAFMPRPRPGEEILLGWWPEHGLCYAFFTGEQSRGRLLLVLLAPLLLLSVIPLLLLRMTGTAWPGLALALALHALLCGGDLVGAWLVARQVPSGGRVRNQGWRTYWRPSAQGGEPDPAPTDITDWRTR